MSAVATRRCPACHTTATDVIHQAKGLPVNSVLLVRDRAEAITYPLGDMELRICPQCGFVFNQAWGGESQYDSNYEETQAHSPTFRDFARALAADWVDRHGLTGGRVIEIGCGSAGEFLQYMVDAGVASATGVDPALKVERIDRPDASAFEWRPEPYDSAFGPLDFDAVICRHTLEHIGPVKEFLDDVRTGIGDRRDTVVLFELPDVTRILTDIAFEDVYYEHCSYFSPGSLARLFRRCGFEVTDVRRAYADQYVLLEARIGDDTAVPAPIENDLDLLLEHGERYSARLEALAKTWATRLREVRGDGGRSVIWGGGSKGVAFLTSLGLTDEVDAVVDINPVKQGKYMAGTGHRVVAPEELVAIAPSLVVVMNAIYEDEIRTTLADLGVRTEVRSL